MTRIDEYCHYNRSDFKRVEAQQSLNEEIVKILSRDHIASLRQPLKDKKPPRADIRHCEAFATGQGKPAIEAEVNCYRDNGPSAKVFQ